MMVSLNLRAKKTIFLDYATMIKGYRLRYPDSKSPKFVISRDVTFDENFMFQLRMETVVDSTGSERKLARK